mgnify:CR=1 FL=1
MSIESIGKASFSSSPILGAAAENAAAPKNTPSFADKLMDSIGDVNSQINDAQKMSQDFLLGGKQPLHEVMINLEKADLSFRFMVQVRNKVLDAYNEVMRIQV